MYAYVGIQVTMYGTMGLWGTTVCVIMYSSRPRLCGTMYGSAWNHNLAITLALNEVMKLKRKHNSDRQRYIFPLFMITDYKTNLFLKPVLVPFLLAKLYLQQRTLRNDHK